MKTSAPALVPFLRSDAQARLLASLALDPDREATLTELALEMGVAVSSAHREVDRLVESGMIAERRAGRTRLLRIDLSYRYLEPLILILAGAYGPVQVVRDELAEVPDVVEAVIFGSYAARYTGQPGDDPHDIDVLVVGDSPGRVQRRAAARMEDLLHRRVQITTVTEQEWADSDSGSLRGVRARPTLPVDLSARAC